MSGSERQGSCGWGRWVGSDRRTRTTAFLPRTLRAEPLEPCAVSRPQKPPARAPLPQWRERRRPVALLPEDDRSQRCAQPIPRVLSRKLATLYELARARAGRTLPQRDGYRPACWQVWV
jgi:hypothetical protein